MRAWSGFALFLLVACGGGGQGRVSPEGRVGAVRLAVQWAGTLSPGSPLQVEIRAESLPGLLQGSFRIQYDTSRLSVNAVDPGSFWVRRHNEMPACTGTLAVTKDFQNTGILIVTLSRPGRQCGATDRAEGVIATIIFRAKQTIPSPNNLVSFVSDPQYQIVRDAEGNAYPVERITEQEVFFQLPE